MKIGKLDFKRWEWGGRELLHPAKIVWRAVWLLPMLAAKVLLCSIVLVGWGQEAAEHCWKEIS